MSQSPAISVLMPIYNARPFLAAAMDSVLAQTFGDLELVAVDDGSTDGSLEMLRKYEAADPRVRVISRPNTGIVGALSDGLAACRADFIARMDGDDTCSPDRFAKQAAYLNEHTECVAVGCQVLLTDETGSPICIKKDTLFSHEEIDAAHLSNGWPLTHGALMMRREAVLRVGGYREQYKWLEDLDLFLRLAEIGKLANLPEVLYRYRQHPGSICWTRQGEQLIIRQALYVDTRKRRGLPEQSMSLPPAQATYASSEVRRIWAWWALAEGNISTARRLALKVFTSRPASLNSWRLMACAIRGH
ncbi:MAG TPA: glycosyltransferase [Tepidisphaeraceae bacterium]|nr:glycosyltransferase [Tepidisphaeraceae bacterium]